MKNIKMGHRPVGRNVRKGIRRGIPERGTTDGSVTKGDGPRFVIHKEKYRTLFGVRYSLMSVTLCGFVRLALPCFPAIHVGYIRIERTCSFAETLLVDFTVVDFLGDTFRFFTVFQPCRGRSSCRRGGSSGSECYSRRRTIPHIRTRISEYRRCCFPKSGSLASDHATAQGLRTR